jgi:hypothetical protein
MENLRLNDEINALILEKSALSKMLADTRQELYEKAKYQDILNSKRYRIGSMIVETVKNPLKIFLWPSWILKKSFTPLTDIHRYLKMLKQLKRDYIIIIAVRDTPGLALNKTVAREILRLGFKVNLQNKHWHSYIGVVDAGKVIHEQISAEEEALSYKSTVGGFAVEITSKSLNVGNLAAIKIDGKDYAVNKRGLNIVVIEKDTRKVVDTVCFDTHEPKFGCTR